MQNSLKFQPQAILELGQGLVSPDLEKQVMNPLCVYFNTLNPLKNRMLNVHQLN